MFCIQTRTFFFSKNAFTNNTCFVRFHTPIKNYYSHLTIESKTSQQFSSPKISHDTVYSYRKIFFLKIQSMIHIFSTIGHSTFFFFKYSLRTVKYAVANYVSLFSPCFFFYCSLARIQAQQNEEVFLSWIIIIPQYVPIKKERVYIYIYIVKRKFKLFSFYLYIPKQYGLAINLCKSFEIWARFVYGIIILGILFEKVVFISIDTKNFSFPIIQ